MSAIQTRQKARLLVSKAYAEVTPYSPPESAEAKTNTVIYNEDARTEHFAPTAQSSIIAGSTFSNNTKNAPEFALDAAGTRFIVNEDGVRTGVVMATSDGYGHGHDNLECTNIANAAESPCDFVLSRTAEQLKALGMLVLAEAGAHAKTVSQTETSSLTTTHMQWNPSARAYDCDIHNVGDGMAVVLDPKFNVIYASGARTHARETWGDAIEYNPWPVQTLSAEAEAEAKSDDSHTQSMHLQIPPNSFVLHMTDGIWSELETMARITTDGDETPAHKDAVIDKAALTTLLQEKLDSKTATAHDVALVIQNAAVENIKAQMAQFQAINSGLKSAVEFLKAKRQEWGELEGWEAQRDASQAYTVAQWITDAGVPAALVRDIQTMFFSDSSGSDGVHFTEGFEGTPAIVFEGHLKKKTFGDCATIAVTKAPELVVEILRAISQYPYAKFRKLFKKYEITKEPAKAARDILLREKILFNPFPEKPARLSLIDKIHYSQGNDHFSRMNKADLQRYFHHALTLKPSTATALNYLEAACSVYEHRLNKHSHSIYDKLRGKKHTPSFVRFLTEAKKIIVQKLQADLADDSLLSSTEKMALKARVQDSQLFTMATQEGGCGTKATTIAFNEVRVPDNAAAAGAGVGSRP